MAFGKLLPLNNSDATDVIRVPGGVDTALACVCVVPLFWRTAALRLVPR
jgi:hypothetical protein